MTEPPKPQLFISHSTSGNDAAKKTLQALAEGIQDKCRLLLDRSSLQPGEDWRSTINVWTGTCDVALLFITPEAVRSEYCQYEWSILSYRRKLVPTFRVIPVYAGVTPEELKGKPHQIAEIQNVITFESLDAAVAAVIEALAAVNAGERPSQLQADLIARLLKKFVERSALLKVSASRAKFDLGQWNPFDDEWKQFALRLMGVGLRRAMIAVREFKDHYKDAHEDYENLAALVDALNKAKPAATKGIFLKKLSVSSTMGVGVKVDPTSLQA